MCGISGQFNFNNDAVHVEDLRRMSAALTHRGPDDEGIYCKASVGLAHRRLSIIDLSHKGKQPIWSNDKTMCVVYNGEVYNFKQIREELLSMGYHFSSATDTEVIVNAVQCWGVEKAVERFIGMYAFVIWDRKNKRLLLCRDRAGVKPLYYYNKRGMFLFASELKALLMHPDFKKELDFAALSQHFVNGYILGPRTVFKNTSKLLPGHYAIVEANGKMNFYRYWGLNRVQRNSFHGSFGEAVEILENLLESAFSYRLVADVPVGLFLSGGIDSSLLSSILKKKTASDILHITIGFQEQTFDESEKATKVAKALGVRHIVHRVNTAQARQALFKFCEIYDEPFGDTSGIPTFILSKVAREHVKVALSADGGDEQFCGYEGYASYLKNYTLLKRIPLLGRLAVATFLEKIIPYEMLFSLLQGRGKSEMSYVPQGIGRYEKMLSLLRVSDVYSLLLLMNQKAFSPQAIGSFLERCKSDFYSSTPLSRESMLEYNKDKEITLDAMMRMDYSAFLRDDILVKVDRASMFVSLECRDPFLDHRIAEFAYSLPESYVYDKGEHKRILKKILRKWVGEDVVASPKRGFMIPLYRWLHGVWKPVVMEYLSKRKVKAIGVLDEQKVESEVNRFYKYQGCRAEKIWMLLNFQMWAEKWYCAR